MTDKYMAGTKFYYYPDKHSNVPLVIRLKKEAVSFLSFVCGGTVEVIDRATYDLIKKDDNWAEDAGGNLYRYNAIISPQKWTLIGLNDDEAEYRTYHVEKMYIKLTNDQLKERFTKLAPDGFITISNIYYKNNQSPDGEDMDVLITVHRRNERTPFAFCRQNAIDVFNYDQASNTIPIGLVISRETCPKNIDIEAMMAADRVEDFKAACFYLDDDMDTILSYLGSLNKYNTTIKKLEEKYATSMYTGCAKSVTELVTKKYLFGEVRLATRVKSWAYPISKSRDSFNDHELSELGRLYDINTSECYYVPYSRAIDFSKLDGRYTLMACRFEDYPKNQFVMVFAYH